MSLKKIWNFIWNDNSIWSWVINIILAFVIVKFILLPLLGFTVGTSIPLVAVTSGSMDHHGNFDEWWGSKGSWYESRGYTKSQVKSWSLHNGFKKGDVIFIASKKSTKTGDVIVYSGLISGNIPIIHRVVDIKTLENANLYITKGDANSGFLKDPRKGVDEEQGIPEQNVLGRAVLKIPFVGWIKILASCSFSSFDKNIEFLSCMKN